MNLRQTNRNPIGAGLQLLTSVALLALLLLMIGLYSCSGDRTENSGTSGKDSVKSYLVRGRVVAVSRAHRMVVIAHNEIKGYMAAMTMPFTVKDTVLLDLVHPKDSVEAILKVSRTESWLSSVRVVKPAPVETSSIDWTKEFKKTSILKLGDHVPDFSLVNQENKRIHLSDWRGKVVVMTFIYTRCPLPDYCILMTNNFSKIQRSLKSDSDLDGRWHLLTISFDPKFDTPKRLKEYGKTYGADFSSWSFGTASLDSIRRISSRFQQAFWTDEGGLITHNLVTAVIDPLGTMYKIYTGNTWVPQNIVEDVRGLSHPVSSDKQRDRSDIGVLSND
jgi:protein SCO1/2